MGKYIVHVERRGRKDPRKVSGVVEQVGKRGSKRFLGPGSLWRILTTPWGTPERTGRLDEDDNGNAVTLARIMKQLADEED